MSFFDTIKNLLGSGASKKLDQNGDGKLDAGDLGGLKDQAMNVADTNNDGQVNSEDLGKAKEALDVAKSKLGQ